MKNEKIEISKKENKPPKRLGEILLERGLISEEQLKIALEIQKATGKLLGEVLVELGFIERGAISSLLSSDLGIKYISSIKDIRSDSQAISLVPQDFARRYKLVPLSIEGDVLTVLMANPFDVVAVDELKQLTEKDVNTIMAPEDEIEKAIDIWYSETESFEELVERAITNAVDEVNIEESPVVKLVDIVIINAIKKRATDIHIGCEKNAVIVRYRIDGILHVWNILPKVLANAMISRIKVMSNLDISETRIPQDGRIQYIFAGRNIDLRVSTYPTYYGENIVMRILDKTKLISKIDFLGYSEHQLKVYRELLKMNNGIVLVTGPTGSGKTTSLYAALLEINSTRINIMTVEDPIEYELPFVKQSQINPRAGFSFAFALRAILRQDPDVIMVGEIRDEETLDVALHAALTGHLVLSTLHTNSSIAAISRLIFMGTSPYILASGLKGVVAQRLVRVICPNCKERYEPSNEEKELLKNLIGTLPHSFTLYKGRGCEKCMGTGYLGRTALSEVFKIDEDIFSAIVKQKDETHIRELLKKQGFVSLFEDGLSKVLKGITTIEEVLRVA